MKNTDYRTFALKHSSRKKESIEWSITYHYNAPDTKNPRLLLIGDSICNGYQQETRTVLTQEVNLSFWASSKCVTDPDYLRELDFLLSGAHFDFICFNNGLHSLKSDMEEYRCAFASALRFIREKCPDARLAVVTSTPLVHEENTAVVRKLNAIAVSIASELGLDVLDLFAVMDPLDRTNWRDEYHYGPAAIRLQAETIAAFFRKHNDGKCRIDQEGTATGPDGAIQ